MKVTIVDKKVPVAQIKQFEVTGILHRSTKRFKKIYNSFEQANMINLWRGSVWARLDSGKRVLISRTYN